MPDPNSTYDKEQRRQDLIEEYMPVIISRKEWGAKKARRKHKIKHPITSIVFLHTKTNPCYDKDHCSYEIRKIQKKHMEKGKSDIQYNFIIGRDGSIFEGRGWESTPSKYRPDPDGLNEETIEIAFVGHSIMHPNQRQIHSVMGLMMVGTKMNYLGGDINIMQSEIDEPMFAEDANNVDNLGKGVVIPYYEENLTEDEIEQEKLDNLTHTEDGEYINDWHKTKYKMKADISA